MDDGGQKLSESGSISKIPAGKRVTFSMFAGKGRSALRFALEKIQQMKKDQRVIDNGV